jgi:Tfp pilus assembly protein PilO
VSTSDIIVTVVAVIIIIISTIFLVSNIITLKKLNQDISDMNESMAAKQETLNKLVELGKSEDILREEYDRSELYIPSERNEVGITSDITSVISDTGGQFGRLTFLDEEDNGNGITIVPFVIRVDSTYEELKAIIDYIVKTDRLYIIETVLIDESSTEEGRLVVDITINAYYRKN